MSKKISRRSKRDKQREIISKMTIEEKTEIYWKVSSACKRGIGPYQSATTEDVLGKLADIKQYITPKRKLDSNVANLLDFVILEPKEETTITPSVVSVLSQIHAIELD